MVYEPFLERISDDWLWREKELRESDKLLLRNKSPLQVKSSILIVYSHWEGHFKTCASELLEFMCFGIKRKIFAWTSVSSEVRLRLLFCNYRRSSIAGQTQETFVSYLNALGDSRYAGALEAKAEIIMIDDNLNALRAEAICRNLGVTYSWCSLKKVIIDERILDHRNAIAHGSARLRSGDEMNLLDSSVIDSISIARDLIREAKDKFQNAIVQRTFLGH